ncbi:ferrous iron transport B family protein, partial [Yersinia pestis PY-63]
MLDIAESQHIEIDINTLSKKLGCPVIPLVSTRGRGIDELKNSIDQFHPATCRTLVSYPPILLSEVDKL